MKVPDEPPTRAAAADAAWQPLDPEAVLLAERLRAARLTILYPRRHAAATSFLLHGVVPLVQQPTGEPTRRGSARGPEIGVFFDEWTGDPMRALRKALREATGLPAAATPRAATLAETLSRLVQRDNSRFLFVFDGFETCLRQAEERAEARAFVAEWAEALARPGLAANFLIALSEDESTLLEPLYERLPALDDDCMVFATSAGRIELLPLFGPPAGSAPDDGFSDSLAEGLQAADDDDAEVAVAALPTVEAAPVPEPKPGTDDAPTAPHVEPLAPHLLPAWEREVADALPSAEATPPPADAAPTASPWIAPDEAPAAPEAAAGHPARRAWRPLVWVILAVLIGLGIALWWRGGSEQRSAVPQASLPSPPPAPISSPPPALAAPAAAPASGTAPTVLPVLEVLVDARADMDARTAADLQRFVSTAAGVELRPVATPAGLAALLEMATDGRSRFAIAPYPLLQAAAQHTRTKPLSVITPLYRQEILFIVRADAPYRFIHDIKGLRIEAGAAGSSRAIVADAVHRRLFGVARVAAPATAGGPGEALDGLLARRSADVIVVSGEPPDWLDRLPLATRRAIKLLRLDRKDARDRRALQTFLPWTLHHVGVGRSASDETPTLSVLTFLVTNAAGADEDAATHITAVARSLCENLPRMRREGHAKWAQVRLGAALPADLSFSAAARSAFRDCDRAAAAGR